MEIGAVIERVRAVADARADAAPDRVRLEAGLVAVTQLRSWLAAGEADLARRLAGVVSFPEKSIADCTRGSHHDAARTRERAETLAAIPGFADALEAGIVTAGHVDAITRTAKPLTDSQRAAFTARIAGLAHVAGSASVDEFRRRLAMEARAVQHDDGMARLERQRRAARLRSWTDLDGMICLTGRFDPLTGRRITARLDAAVEALFAEATPDSCPNDPIEKQHHLAALALARLLGADDTGNGDGDGNGDGVAAGLVSGLGAARPGRPEFVVVIDTSVSGGGGGPQIDWGIPIEIPTRVLNELLDGGDVHTIVVRNGVILHAPGRLDLGRSTRLANRAQRRALRALYATCAIPGCEVRYDRCKLHHVIWWRHGGRTDLDNLLPVCAAHHTCIHDQGWHITLGRDRHLTITYPDGTIHNTSPPKRRAA